MSEVYWTIKAKVNESTELWKQRLSETRSYETEVYENTDKAYESFLDKVSVIYDSFFPEEKIKVKVKIDKFLWITKEIEESST